jgi:chaperonin cofactor prefoldin
MILSSKEAALKELDEKLNQNKNKMDSLGKQEKDLETSIAALQKEMQKQLSRDKK